MSVVKQFPVEKEYEKNPDISPEDIQKLRVWLETQPHLPGEYLTDLDLFITFHCCDKSPEVSKQVLDLHFTLRTLFTTFFKNRHLDKNTELALNTVLITQLPSTTVYGYSAVYLRLLDPDPRLFNVYDTCRALMMLFDLCQYQQGTWPGFVIIVDLDQAVWGHVMKLELMAIRQILYFLQECMLVKLKEVHLLNAPSFMDKLMALLKPFMKKELLDIIQIHQPGSQVVYDFVPKKAFPKEEGGEYKDHNTIRDEVIKWLHSNAQFFRDENRRRVTESLRPHGRGPTVETLFGIQGSFKKLDID